MIIPYKKPPNGEPGEAAKEANRSISRIRRAGRADHRPHQVLENPPAPTTGAPGPEVRPRPRLRPARRRLRLPLRQPL